MPAPSVQPESASARSPSAPLPLLDFVNFKDRQEALWTLKKRTEHHMAQGVGVLEALSRAGASLGSYLVGVIRRADHLTPSIRLYKRLSKLTVAQHAGNAGQTITGTDLMRWWAALRMIQRHDRSLIVAVTLDLSPKVEALALAQPEPADYLRKRINHHAKRALGAAPAGIWTTGIVSTSGDRLHMHGLVAIDPDHLEGLTIALRKAGGTVAPAFREHQAHIAPAWSARALLYVAQNAQEEGSVGRVHGRTIVATGLRDGDLECRLE